MRPTFCRNSVVQLQHSRDKEKPQYNFPRIGNYPRALESKFSRGRANPAQAMKKTTPTILLVDDDPNDLLLLETAFEEAGLKVRIQQAVGGQDAINYLSAKDQYADRAARELPHFVITDLKMPDVDGFEVLEFLKSRPELAFIPAVVFSGSADDDDIRRSYELGAASYHVKPSDPSMLFTLVKALHAYWVLCELPETDGTGIRSGTASGFKLGERFYNRPRA